MEHGGFCPKETEEKEGGLVFASATKGSHRGREHPQPAHPTTQPPTSLHSSLPLTISFSLTPSVFNFLTRACSLFFFPHNQPSTLSPPPPISFPLTRSLTFSFMLAGLLFFFLSQPSVLSSSLSPTLFLLRPSLLGCLLVFFPIIHPSV